MKATTTIIMIFAILATAVFSTSLSDSKIHVHFHFDQPAKSSRASGIVSRLINLAIQRDNSNIELHLHFDQLLTTSEEDDAEIEEFDIGSILANARAGLEKVKQKIAGIRLPHISIPNLVQPIIDFSKLMSRLIPCAQTLQNVIPNLIIFAKAVAAGNSIEAIQQILKVLTFTPDISSKCLGQNFSIPPKVMNEIQCAADITALTSRIAQFILVPETIISNLSALKDMFDLIPKTISDCTDAFN